MCNGAEQRQQREIFEFFVSWFNAELDKFRQIQRVGGKSKPNVTLKEVMTTIKISEITVITLSQ